MIKVHVDRHSLAETEPPFIVDTGAQKFATPEVFFLGKTMLVWKPDEPLECGAAAWLQTQEPISFLNMYGTSSTVYPNGVANDVSRAGPKPCGCGE